jgi:hypothetical protein
MRACYDRAGGEYDDLRYLTAAELGGGEVLYDGRWFVVVRGRSQSSGRKATAVAETPPAGSTSRSIS